MRYTRRQRWSAALGAVLPVAGWFAGGSVGPACGGAQGPTAIGGGLAVESDPGSGPVDCSVTGPYEMKSIENFEYGAATGWYTNNEVCYPYTQAYNECFEAGMVCFPGSQATPACQQDGSPVGVWASCYGTGPVDCNDAGAALANCAAQCASIQPSPPFSADQLPASVIPGGGRCGSHYAMHIVGGPFGNWGGNIGRRFGNVLADGGAVGALDATGYDGIAVWARTAPGFANAPRLSFSDIHTDSQVNMYPSGVTQPDGGYQATPKYCDPNPNCSAQTASGNPNCYNVGCDRFGQYMPLTEDWRLFLLPFTEMRQGGWGKQWPEPDLSAILSIQIDFPQGSWDFWVDDIALYRQKTP